MAKNKNPNEPEVLHTSIDPETGICDLPFVGSTTNFQKWGHPFERGGQGDQLAGILYIPHQIAKGLVGVRVTLIREKK